jgi:hypothetical protein
MSKSQTRAGLTQLLSDAQTLPSHVHAHCPNHVREALALVTVLSLRSMPVRHLPSASNPVAACKFIRHKRIQSSWRQPSEVSGG